jgi:hypothetical protein
MHGADVTGIEILEGNIKKALLAKDAIGLDNVIFEQDDVRNISLETHGKFDAIICSGILYHFSSPDVFFFVEKLYEMVGKVVIIDTVISLNPSLTISHKGREYTGSIKETDPKRQLRGREEWKRNWARDDGDMSSRFVFTRPSLINFLSHVGFSSIYECFNPPHINFGKPGIESKSRCTFVAIKGEQCKLETSPAANNLKEDWPEDSLIYAYEPGYRKIIRKLTPPVLWTLLRRIYWYVISAYRK